MSERLDEGLDCGLYEDPQRMYDVLKRYQIELIQKVKDFETLTKNRDEDDVKFKMAADELKVFMNEQLCQIMDGLYGHESYSWREFVETDND